MERKVFLAIVLIVCACVCAAADISSTTVHDSSTSASVTVANNDGGVAVDENLLEGKSNQRHPKFGFAIPFPNIPGMVVNGDPGATPGPDMLSGMPVDGAGAGTSATLGTTAILIKGGILSGLMALKAAIIPPIFLGALILFLIAGAAFFTCSIVNCGRFVGDFAGGTSGAQGFGGFPNPFTRNGIDDYNEQRPVFQALDDGYKKYR